MSRIHLKVVLGATVIATIARAFTSTQRLLHRRCSPLLVSSSRRFGSSNDNDYSENTPYRSIGEVVGDLHGGKYQFQPVVAASAHSLDGPSSNGFDDETNQQPLELPQWALQMKPQDNSPILQVPSNANRTNGMIRSARVTIANDERTWEHYHARIVSVDANGNNVSNNEIFMVQPSSGDLAPRGGASKACDASQPYSDSATLQVIHKEGVAAHDDGTEYFLLIGTEEEKWSYQLILSE